MILLFNTSLTMGGLCAIHALYVNIYMHVYIWNYKLLFLAVGYLYDLLMLRSILFDCCSHDIRSSIQVVMLGKLLEKFPVRFLPI